MLWCGRALHLSVSGEGKLKTLDPAHYTPGMVRAVDPQSNPSNGQ